MDAFSAAELGLPESVPCVFCGGATELHSPFGSQLSVATYWCRACGTAFDWFRASPGAESEAGRGGESGQGGDRAGNGKK